MEADLKYYVQAIITVVLLTDPFMRPMLFKSMTAQGGAEAHERPTSFEGSVIAALVAVAVGVALMPLGYLVLAKRINLSERGMALLTKFGGLFVATIGIQLILSGLQQYFD